MKKIIILLVFAILLTSLIGCQAEKSTDMMQSEETEALMAEINNQVGMPDMVNFYEKKLLKELYELRDDSELICYAYTVNKDGQYVYQGKCIGYGLPYAVQFSNPQKYTGVTTKQVIDDGGRDWTWSYEVMPQAEPNGLFMPDALSATWLIMINEETGELEPMYCEPTIIVRQSKAPRRLCAEWSLPPGY